MDPVDRDLMIRTVIGEAGNQGENGMAGVAHVIMNRTRAPGRYGSTPGDVVLAKHQFEPWSTRSDQLLAIDPNSPRYQAAARIVDGVANGTIPDPTNGATHFANVQTVLDRNNGTVGNHTWLNSAPTATIGAHTFFAPSGPVKPAGAGVQMPQGTTGVPSPVAASPVVTDTGAGAVTSPDASVQQGLLGKLLIGSDAKPGGEGWQGQPIIPYVLRQTLGGARGALTSVTSDAPATPSVATPSSGPTGKPPMAPFPQPDDPDVADFPAPQVGLTADGFIKQMEEWDRRKAARSAPAQPAQAYSPPMDPFGLSKMFNLSA